MGMHFYHLFDDNELCRRDNPSVKLPFSNNHSEMRRHAANFQALYRGIIDRETISLLRKANFEKEAQDMERLQYEQRRLMREEEDRRMVQDELAREQKLKEEQERAATVQKHLAQEKETSLLEVEIELQKVQLEIEAAEEAARNMEEEMKAAMQEEEEDTFFCTVNANYVPEKESELELVEGDLVEVPITFRYKTGWWSGKNTATSYSSLIFMPFLQL